MPTARLKQPATERTIWERLLTPQQPDLTPEVARLLLSLEYSPADKERMNQLAAKARSGQLTSEEEEEIDSYGRVGSVLGILKSKARRSLKRTGGQNG